MKMFWVSLILLSVSVSQIGYADIISISCKNTKVPGAGVIQLGNGEDLGTSGPTSGAWSLAINGHEIKNAYVKVLGKDASKISGFLVLFQSGRKLHFSPDSNNNRAFVSLLGEDGKRLPQTVSFCTMDID